LLECYLAVVTKRFSTSSKGILNTTASFNLHRRNLIDVGSYFNSPVYYYLTAATSNPRFAESPLDMSDGLVLLVDGHYSSAPLVAQNFAGEW
jgi:hypothetical protein